MSPHALIGAELGYISRASLGARNETQVRDGYGEVLHYRCWPLPARERGGARIPIGRGLGPRRVDCGRGTPNSRSRQPIDAVPVRHLLEAAARPDQGAGAEATRSRGRRTRSGSSS